MASPYRAPPGPASGTGSRRFAGFIFALCMNQLGGQRVVNAKAGSVSRRPADETKVSQDETVFRSARRCPETGHGYQFA
jgi:hypothetical protein